MYNSLSSNCVNSNWKKSCACRDLERDVPLGIQSHTDFQMTSHSDTRETAGVASPVAVAVAVVRIYASHGVHQRQATLLYAILLQLFGRS